jgi:hypothetical protein
VILAERGKQLEQETDVEKATYAGGARTGFITRDYKGKDADTAVYSFDAALMRERRELRRQIAQELGEWADERRLSLALPKITSAAGVLDAVSAVLAAVAAGEVTTGEAQRLAALLEAQRKSLETLQIEQRLAAIEQVISSSRTETR